jgi:hypothetical protein
MQNNSDRNEPKRHWFNPENAVVISGAALLLITVSIALLRPAANSPENFRMGTLWKGSPEGQAVRIATERVWRPEASEPVGVGGELYAVNVNFKSDRLNMDVAQGEKGLTTSSTGKGDRLVTKASYEPRAARPSQPQQVSQKTSNSSVVAQYEAPEDAAEIGLRR